MTRLRLLTLAALFSMSTWAAPAGAQAIPAEGVTLAGGALSISGDASATFGSDDPGFFNYTDYEHSALRGVRLGLSAALKAGAHVSLLGELRTENSDALLPYALYVRIRPWTGRNFDIQAGRIPPNFGAFARRGYGLDTPLIGYPLAYQYLTSIRPDALPVNADDLLLMRGRGWLSNFSEGSREPYRGVPLVSALRWDTGVQVRMGSTPVEASVAITTGTVSNPLVRDDNGGKQMSGRLALRPATGLVIGASAARGAFISRGVESALPAGQSLGRFTQQALGADVEYSRGYWLVRGEMVFSQWTLPALSAPFLADPLRASAVSIEARYKIMPGLYAAARVDHLGFSRVTGTDQTDTWDAPVTRVEAGGGYSITRNLIAKLAYQYNDRDGGRERTFGTVIGQLYVWF